MNENDINVEKTKTVANELYLSLWWKVVGVILKGNLSLMRRKKKFVHDLNFSLQNTKL